MKETNMIKRSQLQDTKSLKSNFLKKKNLKSKQNKKLNEQ